MPGFNTETLSTVHIGSSQKRAYGDSGPAQRLDSRVWWCVILTHPLPRLLNTHIQLSGGIVFTIYENIIMAIGGREVD